MEDNDQQMQQPEEAKRDIPYPAFEGYEVEYDSNGDERRVTVHVENSETGVDAVEYHVEFAVGTSVRLRNVTYGGGERPRMNDQTLEAIGFAEGVLAHAGFDTPDVAGVVMDGASDAAEETDE